MAGRQAFALGWALSVGLVFIGLACQRPNTVFGTVALAPGVEESIEGTVVGIYARPDSLRSAYRLVPVQPTGSARRARFRIDSLPMDDYWLRAWKDLNADDSLSDGDLTGVLGGGSARDSAGRRFWLGEGWVYDVGEIELERFEELVIVATGERYSADTLTRFTYRFNHDVLLGSLAIRFPHYGEFPDGGAPGPKRADTAYESAGWRFGGGVMPTDTHRLVFRGRRGEDTFRIRVSVRVE